MSTKYVMQEMVDLQNEGQTLLYPRLVLMDNCSMDELAQQVAEGSTFGAGEVKGMICQVAKWMAMMMAMGRSVTLEGIGTFTPAVGLKKGREREKVDGSGVRRNAASVRVNNVHFRADKGLVDEVERICRLERSAETCKLNRSKFTPEERLALARQFLEKHAVMSINDYVSLTGLGRTTAGQELRRWAAQEDSGIGTKGNGSHRVYVRRKGI